MTVGGGGRRRIIARKGIDKYAGPTTRQLVVARLLPVAGPLLFQVLTLAGVHPVKLYYFLAAALLLWSARTFMETGIGLGMLMLIQVFAALLATALLAAYLLSTSDWLWYSGITLLMMGYVSYVFNVIGSYLPR
ncbi:MAG: hypothetical protein ABI836_00585 [Gemmatimonadota bacterium]